MPKVSVIIPVYNTAKYLKECLDSVISQTLADIEIICIDDGSTDSSLEILKEYASKDERIRVLEQKNQGAGAARNFGITQAKGEFLLFFDSDDLMNVNMLQELYNRALETKSDITICRSEYLKLDLSKAPISFSVEKDIIGDALLVKPLEFSKYIFQFCVGWPWDKLYKKDFIAKNNLRFQNLRHSNDTYFVLLSLVLANQIAIVDRELVVHRLHESSLESTRIKSPNCYYYALKALYFALKKANLYKIYEQSFVNYCITFSFWHIDSIEDKKAKEKMLSKFAKLYKTLKFNEYEESYFFDLEKYKILSAEAKYKLFPRNIFSIRNSDDGLNKVINIFGIKIKVRRKVR